MLCEAGVTGFPGYFSYSCNIDFLIRDVCGFGSFVLPALGFLRLGFYSAVWQLFVGLNGDC